MRPQLLHARNDPIYLVHEDGFSEFQAQPLQLETGTIEHPDHAIGEIRIVELPSADVH